MVNSFDADARFGKGFSEGLESFANNLGNGLLGTLAGIGIISPLTESRNSRETHEPGYYGYRSDACEAGVNAGYGAVPNAIMVATMLMMPELGTGGTGVARAEVGMVEQSSLGAQGRAGTFLDETAQSFNPAAYRYTTPAAQETEYVATLMGKNGPKYYNNAGATLGGKGGTVWIAPLEDYASLSTRSDVVTATGHAPGVLNSYLKGDSMYGVAVPKNDLSLRLPAATDAGANRHWRPGGFTGVEHDGAWTSSGVREFIMDGGQPMPKGSVFFQINTDGSWTPIRRF
jgi:hypothetical protein